MANTGVSGRLVNTEGNGIGGLIVVVYDVEALDDDVVLGTTTSSGDGNFSVSYSSWSYGWLESEPDIRIRVFDRVARLIYQSDEFENVTDTTLALGNITIPRNDYEGWLVTLLTGIHVRISQNLITPRIDNKIAWEALMQDVNSAGDIVVALQLYFDVEELFLTFSSPSQPDQMPGGGQRLEDALLNANRNRDVDVQFCLNDFMGFPYPTDTAGRVESFFDDESNHSIEVRGFSRPVNTPMHAKFFIIDGNFGHINASPLLQEYYDDPTHTINNPRRGDMTFPRNAIRVPVHDVSLTIKGEAIQDLQDTFNMHWLHLGGTEKPMTIAPAPSSNAAVQIVRTLPGNLFVNAPYSVPEGEKGILEAYLRAIKNAEDFIYVENQYFTERKIADALFLAMLRNTDLQVIMLINNAVDIPFYQGWQRSLVRQLLRQLQAANARDRIGIYTLWSHETTPQQRIIRNYVHSKVAIVDNKWATIGSANLDGVSLNLSQHIIPPVTNRDVREERAIELNAVIYNNVDGQPGSEVPDDLRRNLWSEHLGISNVSDSQLTNRPSQGWLKLWKDKAAAKLAGLSSNPPVHSSSKILEWNAEEDPDDFLREAGVPQNNFSVLEVMTEVNSFNLDF
ncbi:phospholipase D-like domain-containing protein [Anaerophaga thermohalophila]|uniref:phospholipase D-like domain-containing protein n=1 Tax=Anaerophaga thermohalophila TaxID=177400 RepID=UPI0003160904|nr:phospholipase D family protein [Anaerophaga thermohalophila]